MANELQGQCWLIDFPSPTMRLVVMKLCDCADPDGTNVFPSVATIARETGYSEAAVRKQLAIARECGLLNDVEDDGGSTFGRTTKVREIDTDKLRLVTGQRVRGRGVRPSSHVFAEVEIDGKTTWQIVPRPVADPTSPPDATPPPGGGVEDADPSTTWRGDNLTPLHDVSGPLHDVSGTPPPGGPNPSRTTTLTLPPNPRAAGEQAELNSGWKGKQAEVTRQLERECRHDSAVRHLLAPVLAARRVRGLKPADLAALARDANALPQPLLAKAAELVIADRRTETVTAEQIAAAVAAVRKGGLMVAVKSGTAQFAAWLEFYDVADPKAAAMMRRFGSWQVPAEWPSSLAGTPPPRAERATGGVPEVSP